jgi:hypothetical protein
MCLNEKVNRIISIPASSNEKVLGPCTFPPDEERPLTVPSLLIRDCVHHVEHNEVWILWKKFGGIAYYYRDIAFLRYFVARYRAFPPRSITKTDFRFSTWNFTQRKASIRIVSCEIFRSFYCSYPEIRTSNLPIYMSYIKDTLSPYPYLTIGTTKRSETFAMNYFRWGISLSKFSSRNSKVSFRHVPEGKRGDSWRSSLVSLAMKFLEKEIMNYFCSNLW